MASDGGKMLAERLAQEYEATLAAQTEHETKSMESELSRLQRIEAAARALSEATGDTGLINPELIKQLRDTLEE